MLKLHSSKSHIWAVSSGCPGSVRISAAIPPRPESPAANEGTQAHKLAANLIDGYLHCRDVLRDAPPSTEMFEAADVYARDVLEVSRKTRVAGGDGVGIEKSILCPDINADMVCVPDCFIYNRDARHLWVWEFKYGHSPVEVLENPQLICNTSAVSSFFKINGYDDQKITVHARVVQPRGFHRDGIIREWEFKLSDIRAAVGIYKNNGLIALSENPPTHSGHHCADCSARFACPAAIQCGVSLYEILNNTIPENMTNESISLFYELILRAKEQIKCLESGIETEVKERLKHGAAIPGFTLEQSVGRLSWSLPTAEIAALGELFGINLKKEMEVITPTQAKKLGLDENLIKQFTKRESIGFNVAPVNIKKMRSIFK
jgi:hypothetical protein